MIPSILVLIGLLLIVIEFYLPGGIMAVLGGIAILSGLILYGTSANSLASFFLFLIGTIVGIILAIRFAIWRILKAKPENSIYSSDDQEGYFASSYDEAAIGKIGVVITDLKPGGFISIDGNKHAAISTSGYIAKDEEVLVVGGQEQSLMVRINKKETS